MLGFLRRWLFSFLIVFVLATLGVVLPLRWLDPPASAFMLGDYWIHDRTMYQDHVPLSQLPAHVPLALIAAEDQNFPRHRGFDTGEIQAALRTHREGGRLRGASTISQQLARNLYLWPQRDWLRKGLESWFTVWLELLLPKARILELYLNLAEFDTAVYGVEAASRHYFGKPAAALTRDEAALLAAALPAPKRLDPARPDAWMLERQRWILRHMDQLGEAWVPR